MSKNATLDQLGLAAKRSLEYSGQVATAAAEAIQEVIDVLKQDKSESVSITIPAASWQQETVEDTDDESEEIETTETSGYSYYYDIPVAGITSLSRAEVTVAPASISTATACGLCPTNETIEGYIRIRSYNIPDEDISAEYWIQDGKEQ